MLQTLFLVLAISGVVSTVEFFFGEDVKDVRGMWHARLGALALSVGVVGLLVLGLKAC